MLLCCGTSGLDLSLWVGEHVLSALDMWAGVSVFLPLLLIPLSQFVVDVRKRLRSIWYQANQLGDEDQMDKTTKYHNWVALPLRTVTVDGPPFSVPRYLHLDLGRQTQRSVARFRLHSHALRVETKSWEHHDGTSDKCGL